MPLSPEDRLQVRNVGLISGLVIAAFIMAPLPDYNVPIGILTLDKQIKRLDKQLATEKEQMDKEKTRISRIPSLQQELVKREPEIKRYASRLPKSTKVPELFRDIDRFKQLSNLDITVQTRLDPVDKGDYVELPIRIEGLGTYDAIATFINQLERNQRFAQVKELKVDEKPQSAGEGQQVDYSHHSVTMKISTFMFKDQVVAEQSKSKGAAGAEKPAAEPAKK